jgi:hypothetical protein
MQRWRWTNVYCSTAKKEKRYNFTMHRSVVSRWVFASLLMAPKSDPDYIHCGDSGWKKSLKGTCTIKGGHLESIFILF